MSEELTEERIDAMAGRELDMAIARVILKWENVRWEGFPDGRGMVLAQDPLAGDMPAPFFSTRLDDTWRLVRALQDRRLYVRLYEWPHGVQAGFAGSNRECWYAWAETAPLAICRAALKACGIGQVEPLPKPVTTKARR